MKKESRRYCKAAHFFGTAKIFNNLLFRLQTYLTIWQFLSNFIAVKKGEDAFTRPQFNDRPMSIGRFLTFFPILCYLSINSLTIFFRDFLQFFTLDKCEMFVLVRRAFIKILSSQYTHLSSQRNGGRTGAIFSTQSDNKVNK